MAPCGLHVPQTPPAQATTPDGEVFWQQSILRAGDGSASAGEARRPVADQHDGRLQLPRAHELMLTGLRSGHRKACRGRCTSPCRSAVTAAHSASDSSLSVSASRLPLRLAHAGGPAGPTRRAPADPRSSTRHQLARLEGGATLSGRQRWPRWQTWLPHTSRQLAWPLCRGRRLGRWLSCSVGRALSCGLEGRHNRSAPKVRGAASSRQAHLALADPSGTAIHPRAGVRC